MLPSPDPNTASLLVVDDDLVTQARLSAYFSQEGYRVLLAGDGETFWRQLEQAAVELVLLDINLPGQDGLSLARELRARDPAIGIILLTSRNDDIDKIVGLEVGADDYVTKPFNPREPLTRGEFEALALLVRHAGEVINRDRLSRAISGHDWVPQDRTVDVLVRRLRTKLDAADNPDSLIATVRGEGYRLAVDVQRTRS